MLYLSLQTNLSRKSKFNLKTKTKTPLWLRGSTKFQQNDVSVPDILSFGNFCQVSKLPVYSCCTRILISTFSC